MNRTSTASTVTTAKSLKPRKMLTSLRNNKKNYWVEYRFTAQQLSPQQIEDEKNTRTHQFVHYPNHTCQQYKVKTVVTPIIDPSKPVPVVATYPPRVKESAPKRAPKEKKLVTSTTTTTTQQHHTVDKRLCLRFILN